MAPVDKYAKAAMEREESVSRILGSHSPKKVVVAGPGTGKTFLFGKLLEGKGNALTLSFVNALIDDLALELCGCSDVRTLHSYARSALATATKKDISIFPRLSAVIGKDAEALLGDKIDFDSIFYVRDEGHKAVPFYIERRNYYAHFGFTDVILAAVRYFEKNPERLPTYDQVLVDEFQDFNQLEVALIDLLAAKSPILLAGDDDQALYDFKLASSEHIRERHGKKRPEYEPFNLPFCSRCTNIIVGAANDIVANAKKSGLLQGRIEKPYTYFDDQRKDKESDRYPHLIVKQAFSRQIPWVIQKQLVEMAETEKGKFSVLVITPTSTQCRQISEHLKASGLRNVEYIEKGLSETSLQDALEVLAEDHDSNLGWRLAAEHLLSSADFEKVLNASKACDLPFRGLVDKKTQSKALKLVRLLKRVQSEKDLPEEDREEFYRLLDIDPWKTAADVLLERCPPSDKQCDPAIRKVPIKVTTVQSSKGLAADLVVIANCDDRYFIRDRDGKVADQDVCSFLVALTRARKKIVLVKTTDADSIFLQWIDPARLVRT